MISSVLDILGKYGRFVKFSHTLFALPFAGIAFILAFLRTPGLTLGEWGMKFFWILVCMVGARSAAMGFNRWADRSFDSKNPRTANREIPAGKISDAAAIVFILLSALLFFVGSWFLNSLSFYLSAPTLFLLLTYSYTKRFTFLCHFYLGLSIGLAPLATWIALREEFSWIPVLWTLGLAFNLSGFDILYALQDKDFDEKEGLHSVPVFFGLENSLWISRFSHVLSLCFLAWAGYESELSGIFWIFWFATGFLMAGEQWIARKNKDGIFPPAFYGIHSWISVVLFAGILLEKLREISDSLRRLGI
ncbi:4-hydroxybenzoate octaprenyltransferase [Leptospira fletcheri]|uniref:4-hydroxybenzoate polyprenyltransferase n=1 Tax=Leptospira fletcheri TaxID=2484981 RepID=A0A4R9GAA8_9LEPT|nr:UbiA-like polyprenyltransferase [Leptospira fletcheri]TGK08658.1 4-hydroxybenzoate octaprenyltransferase [Leptospira fletcheri]